MTTAAKQAQHTPGPWMLSASHRQIVSEKSAPICTMQWWKTSAMRDMDAVNAESFANARLIAAAPALLAACDDVEAAQRGGDYAAAFDAVRAAIALARGAQ